MEISQKYKYIVSALVVLTSCGDKNGSGNGITPTPANTKIEAKVDTIRLNVTEALISSAGVYADLKPAIGNSKFKASVVDYIGVTVELTLTSQDPSPAFPDTRIGQETKITAILLDKNNISQTSNAFATTNVLRDVISTPVNPAKNFEIDGFNQAGRQVIITGHVLKLLIAGKPLVFNARPSTYEEQINTIKNAQERPTYFYGNGFNVK